MIVYSWRGRGGRKFDRLARSPRNVTNRCYSAKQNGLFLIKIVSEDSRKDHLEVE